MYMRVCICIFVCIHINIFICISDIDACIVGLNIHTECNMHSHMYMYIAVFMYLYVSFLISYFPYIFFLHFIRGGVCTNRTFSRTYPFLCGSGTHTNTYTQQTNKHAGDMYQEHVCDMHTLCRVCIPRRLLQKKPWGLNTLVKIGGLIQHHRRGGGALI